MTINTSAWSGINGFEDIFTAPNSLTNGMFGLTIWVVCYIVLYLVFSQGNKTTDEMEAAFASSAIMAIATALMVVIGMVGAYIAVIPVILSAISAIAMTRRTA